jgi:Flp pilus assembly protein TadD
VLQGYPGSSYLHYLSGKSLLVAGRSDEARRELKEALRLDAANGEAEELLRALAR